MSLSKIDRFVRDLEAIRSYDSMVRKIKELCSNNKDLELKVDECEKAWENPTSALEHVRRSKTMWKSMIDQIFVEMEKPEPRSFPALAIELGLPERITNLMEDRWKIHLRQEFRDNVLRLIGNITMKWRTDVLGGKTDEEIKTMKRKADVHPFQALHGPWSIRCERCTFTQSIRLSDKMIEELLTNSYTELPECLAMETYRHKIRVDLDRVLMQYLEKDH